MNASWWKGFGAGLVLGLAVTIAVAVYATGRIEQLKALAIEQTAQITAEQTQLATTTAANARCSEQLQAVATVNFQLRNAVAQYEAEIQKGQAPGQLLSLLAKLLL